MTQTRFHTSLTSRRSLRSALAFAMVLAFSFPALATEVVKVRVGKHPTFSRVVFELDQPAGYRVEQRGSGAGSELVITLEAASSARSIRSGSAAIARVELDGGSDRTVATVKLRRSGLRIKEMILANPPRIVLDVMLDESSLAVAKPAPVVKAKPAPIAETKPAPKPAPIAEAKPAPEPAPIVKAKPAPKPAPIVEPKPAPVAKTTPAPKPVTETPEPIAATTPVVPEPEAPAIEKSVAPESAPAPETLAKAAADATTKPDAEALTDKNAAAEALRQRIAEAAHAKALRKAEEPKAPIAKPSKPVPTAESAKADSGLLSNPLVLGAGALIALGLVGLVVMIRRRRPLPNDLDVTAIAETGADAPPLSMDSGLGGGLFDEAEAAGSEIPGAQTSDAQMQTPTLSADPATAMPAPPSEASVANEIDSLFDAADAELAPKGDDSMNQEISDLPADMGHAAATPTPPPAAAAPVGASPDPDVLRVVHELERRMAQLEGKLDEANEARDRLERQVAAQSEELRVQRAAIARTQRALRTMSRGDDDKATEPALRDGGETQAKTRVNV